MRECGRTRRLRKEHRVLAEEHEALKSGRLLRQGAEPNTVEICRCIAAEEKAVHSACILYRVLQVSRSGYYAWSERDPSQGQIADEALLRQSRSIGRAARPTVFPASTPFCGAITTSTAPESASGA